MPAGFIRYTILFIALSFISHSTLAGIQVSNDQQLRDAFNQTEDTDITLSAGVRFQPSSRYNLSLNASYRITTDKNNPATFDGSNSTSTAFNITNGAGMTLDYVIVENFSDSAFTVNSTQSYLGLHNITCRNNGSTQSMGGCINANGISRLKVLDSIFENNRASQGGDIYGTAAHMKLVRNSFNGSIASLSGGSLAVNPLPLNQGTSLDDFDRGLWIEQNLFSEFDALAFGAAIQINGSIPTLTLLASVHIANNLFKSSSIVPTLEIPYLGSVAFVLNSLHISGDLANNRASVITAGNLINRKSTPNIVNRTSQDTGSIQPKATCNAFGDGQFLSLGFNILSSTDCPFGQPTDLLNTSPGFTEGDPLLSLMMDSPAVEGQSSEGLLALPSIVTNLLPGELNTTLACGVSDATGLGRPQDANGDGVFECDMGARELRNGPDLGPAQTMAIFDPSRNGEGQVIEILPNGLAVASFFTYGVNGGQDWFVAVGQQVGNTVVFNNVTDATGGRWGSAFNPANITRSTAGQMSLVFSTCEAVDQPGRFMFQATPGSERSDLFNVASRLSTTVSCAGTIQNADSARTGSYFGGSQRDGEGIQYLELSNGQAVAVFYGFDPDGNKFWTISTSINRNGNNVTLQMVYPESTTQFGSSFNPDDVDLQLFGEMQLTFNNNDTVDFNMMPSVTGFESVSYNMVRLTRPAGLTE